jgi:hypothetical protein
VAPPAPRYSSATVLEPEPAGALPNGADVSAQKNPTTGGFPFVCTQRVHWYYSVGLVAAVGGNGPLHLARTGEAFSRGTQALRRCVLVPGGFCSGFDGLPRYTAGWLWRHDGVRIRRTSRSWQPAGPNPSRQQGGTGTTRARVAGRGAGACGRRGDGGSWVGAGMPDRADRTVGFDGNVAPFRRSVEVPLPPPPRLFPDE